MSAASEGRYVPPHLRNRPTPLGQPTPTTPAAVTVSPVRPLASNSRTPWSSSTASTSAYASPAASQSTTMYPSVSSRSSDPNSSGRWTSPTTSTSASVPASHRSSTAPSLYVFGDSFVGPFKLIAEDCAKVQTFKGSSAKGLNNPHSIKQVSAELLPILNSLLAPPPYAYIPAVGRYALLIFGNVDLQINYLWQLQNKPITEETFTSSTSKKDRNHSDRSVDDISGDVAETNPTSDILATATENAGRGPALGPDLFVENVLLHYTTWLDREIIHGPIGQRASQFTDIADPIALSSPSSTTTTMSSPASVHGRRRRAPCKLLVAAALPPLVTDEILNRIPLKYVERLEEDHKRVQQALTDRTEQAERNERGVNSRAPWRVGIAPASPSSNDLDLGMSTIRISDTKAGPEVAEVQFPPTPNSISLSSFEVDGDAGSETNATSNPTMMKISIDDLLMHDPPLCTKPVRIAMTQKFNAGLKAFCANHSNVLSYVDISDSMLAADAAERSENNDDGKESESAEEVLQNGEVDRTTWACPVDPSNIHPLWEPTLPLWLRALDPFGVPTESFKITEDAEETFRAYEADKRKRTEAGKIARGEVKATARVKIRDE